MKNNPEHLLKTLVSIPSVNANHEGEPGVKGEARMVEFLSGWFSDRGFRVSEQEVEPGRVNLLADYNLSGRRHLVVEAHTDTVSVEGMNIAPFDARCGDGKLFGRGACDTKGPMAAAMTALDGKALQALADADYRVTFIGAMGEEDGNTGARHLVESGLLGRPDHILVLEPTRLQPVVAHKGCTWLTIELTGAGAHGSNPDKGVNAIEPLADLIRYFQGCRTGFQGLESHALLGRPTLNLGRVDGGSAVNIVAPSSVLEVDVRCLPGQDLDPLFSGLQQLLDKLSADGRILSSCWRKKETVPFETQPGSGLNDALCRAGEAHGVAMEPTGSGWFSDAGPFSKICDDVVVFGPGNIAQAHTNDEYIELDLLQKGCDILGTMFLELGGKC